MSDERPDNFAADKAGPGSSATPAPARPHQVIQQNVKRQIATRQQRHRRARLEPPGGIWFGVGMFGLVGWAVAVPALLGTAAGLWLDGRGTGRHSWTIMLLIAGTALGCFNAWRWVRQEGEKK